MFEKAKEIKWLKQREIELVKRSDDAMAQNRRLKAELKEIKEPALKIEQERNELKKMVREQTEADLLINALKAVGIIKTEKKQDYFASNDRQLALQQRTASMNTSLRSYGLLGQAAYGMQESYCR